MTKTFPLLPDLTCPELAGYRLPELKQELEPIEIPEGCHEEFEVGYEVGYEIGYNKAREKFEFSEMDLRQALSMAFIAIQDGGNITSDEIISSLRALRTPIAIEVEMEYTCCNLHKNIKPSYVSVNIMKSIRPATHPDGTVKGRWVYE